MTSRMTTDEILNYLFHPDTGKLKLIDVSTPAVAAVRDITYGRTPIANDTTTVDGVVWTWVADADPELNNVELAGELTDCIDNLIAAISPSDNWEFSNMDPVLRLTAIVPGVAANDLVVSVVSSGSHAEVSVNTPGVDGIERFAVPTVPYDIEA